MFNDYDRQLNSDDVEANEHRTFVGGLWDEVGEWQLQLMIQQGQLTPNMTLLDLGCGAFRGGVHFIPYVYPNHYYALDINASLIKAGLEKELPQVGISLPPSHVLCRDDFDASSFNVRFDRVIAISLWSHLTLNHILFSAGQVARNMSVGGVFLSTLFLTDKRAAMEPCLHPGGVVSFLHQDPYHYPWTLVQNAFNDSGLPFRLERLGTCGHARGQEVLRMTKIAA